MGKTTRRRLSLKKETIRQLDALASDQLRGVVGGDVRRSANCAATYTCGGTVTWTCTNTQDCPPSHCCE